MQVFLIGLISVFVPPLFFSQGQTQEANTPPAQSQSTTPSPEQDKGIGPIREDVMGNRVPRKEGQLVRSGMVVAGCLTLLALFFPLWHITLTAPQYPEGLSLEIWAHTIRGSTPYDLGNINLLNHYIGMQSINPDLVPELKLGRPILVALALFAWLTALANSRRLAWIWIGLTVALCLAVAIDFYRWEYDYGHHLDPHAAIQIPGMAYQPPFFGSKHLLNFVATSLPAAGSYLILAALLIAAWSAKSKHAASRAFTSLFRFRRTTG